jgi:hypothetical protein
MNHSDWRDAALNVALQAESQYGEGMEALLREVRLNRAGCATLMLWPDRLQLLRFWKPRRRGFAVSPPAITPAWSATNSAPTSAGLPRSGKAN